MTNDVFALTDAAFLFRQHKMKPMMIKLTVARTVPLSMAKLSKNFYVDPARRMLHTAQMIAELETAGT